MEKLSKEEQAKLIQNFKDAEERIFKKIRERMKSLSKDKKLKEQTLKDLGITFKK